MTLLHRVHRTSHHHPHLQRWLTSLLGAPAAASAVTLCELVVVAAITIVLVAGISIIVVKCFRSCQKVIDKKMSEIQKELQTDNEATLTNAVGSNVVSSTMFIGITNVEPANVRLLLSPNPCGTNWQVVLNAIVNGMSTHFIGTQQCGFFRLEVSR